MDSQAPNQIVRELLEEGRLLDGVCRIRAEAPYGESRFDFYVETETERWFIEVKGVTLKEGDTAKFPDAPTSRGTKHLRGLTQAAAQGYGAYVLFVIQLQPVAYFTPNDGTDPAFGQALRAAKAAGVALLAMDCQVTPWSMAIGQPVEVRL